VVPGLLHYFYRAVVQKPENHRGRPGGGIFSSAACLMSVFAFLCPSNVMAQDNGWNDVDTGGLTIEAVAGRDGTVDTSTPVPLSFLISNYSGRDIDGQLTINDRMSGNEVSLGDVYISQGGTRQFTSIQALPEWYECYAALKVGSTIVWRRELSLSTGKAFDTTANFVLFIDGDGRNLPLPTGIPKGTAAVSDGSTVAPKNGRPVRCLSVKPWQVPRHPGPLTVAQAIILSKEVAVDDLNTVQWQAVAEWMCQGGTVFVHNESRPSIDQLIEAAPLDAHQLVPSSGSTVRHVGLGAIHEYSPDLLSSDGTDTSQQVAETIAMLSRYNCSSLVSAADVGYYRSGTADQNRMWVLSFFGCYTLLSGVVSLLLFRLERRRIAIYISVVVIGASVLSGVLGGMLRVSQGDLRWVTVTHAGTGGAVQVGKILVQSAGGRSTRVGITGERSDLQRIEGNAVRRGSYRYGYGTPLSTGYSPFTWQPSLTPNDTNSHQVDVPMAPWGTQLAHATAYTREMPRLECKLRFQPGASADDKDSTDIESESYNIEYSYTGLKMPSGEFSLELVNHLPVSLRDCCLIIGTTLDISEDADSLASMQDRSYGRNPVTTKDGLIDVYHIQRIFDVQAGEAQDQTFEADFVPEGVNGYWELNKNWEGGSLNLPRLDRLGTTSAWIVGRLLESPILSLDEQHNEFTMQEGLHLFLQEIRQEDMPDASVLFPAEEQGGTKDTSESQI
jgi:hypothetical protein